MPIRARQTDGGQLSAPSGCGNGGSTSPLTSKETLRAAMPFTASIVDDLRKEGFSIAGIKAQENGRKVEWRK